jgi:hypothetical protein
MSLTYKMIKLNSIPQFADYSADIQVPFWPENQMCDVPSTTYRHRQSVVEGIAYFLMNRMSGYTTDGFILEGPTGSGKSSSLRQFLAILNYPIQSDTGTKNTEKEILLGRLDPMEGFLVFKDGPLTTAARHGHCFLLEERDCCPADVNKGMNSILDGYDIHLAESGNGERIALKKGFFFAATQNTTAGNDFSGESPAAELQDSSSEDRYERIYVDYMEESHEIEVVDAHFKGQVPTEVISKCVKAANMCRSVYIGNRNIKAHADLKSQQHRCGLAISTRGILRFVRKVLQFQSNNSAEDMITKALNAAFPMGKVTVEDQKFVEEVFLSQLMQ